MIGNKGGNKPGTESQIRGTVPRNKKGGVPAPVPALSPCHTRPKALFGNKGTTYHANPPYPHKGRGGQEAPRAMGVCVRLNLKQSVPDPKRRYFRALFPGDPRGNNHAIRLSLFCLSALSGFLSTLGAPCGHTRPLWPIHAHHGSWWPLPEGR